jgi:hypothetical protein
MYDVSPVRLLILSTILGIVLAIAVALVFISIQAPDVLKNLTPIAGILPPIFAGLLKLYSRIETAERRTADRLNNTDRKADLAIRKADGAMQAAKEKHDQ